MDLQHPPYRGYIDAENISSKRFGAKVRERLQHFPVLTRVYGCQDALRSWHPLIEAANWGTRMHDGGLQAADWLIRTDAWHDFYAGIRHFVFVTNDGDFVYDIMTLRAYECEVIVIGSVRASCVLQVICTRFLPL